MKRFNLIPKLMSRTVDYFEEFVSIEDYLLKIIRNQPNVKPFYDRCETVFGESDAIDFVYAQGYHEMCVLDAYDSLHSFNSDYCTEYYIIKEGLSELCRRMVNVVKGTCTLNHSVKTITRLKGHLKVDGYEGNRVVITIPHHLFKNFPILSSYDSLNLKGPPLLRIYAKYSVPWFESLEQKNLIPIHDGILMLVYVKEEDILKFLYKGKLKIESDLCLLLRNELETMFHLLSIPDPIWIKPYLWELGFINGFPLV